MIDTNDVGRLPEQGQKLARYLNCKERYEMLLLDMLRANEIPQAEYNSIIKQQEASYSKFLEDLKADNANTKYV